ncbi:MAG: DUF1013 domain-containing protein [Alphaproteobacteria bacterium]|nr:DUF1013 domain-containing protein [Alphaproteobacteria bacterium]
MLLLLMPKATAVWLIDNTSLTFDQVADFTGLHPLEVKGIADGEVAVGLQGVDPTLSGQISLEEIRRCEADPTARLKMTVTEVPAPKARTKGQRYTPVSKRQDRPAAILWLLRYHPELSDAQVSRLVGTTKPTIVSVRERTHWNIQQLKPNDPVSLGLCTQQDLDDALQRARERERRKADRQRREQARAANAAAVPAGASEAGEAPAVAAVPNPADDPFAPKVEGA